MCGIAGVVSAGLEQQHVLSLESALGVQGHRGPDDAGTVILGACALGHNRLAIIDPDLGHQPMSNEDEMLWLVFNGEIYNYVELAEELTALGHRFRTHSDAEVILHAFEEWGEQCQSRFNGMWAYALWDSRRQELFCSRDRFGVKPLCYAYVDGAFWFASEMKTLIAVDRGLSTPNEAQVYRFLRTGLLQEADRTFFRDIRALPAGHSLRLVAGGDPVVRPYYNLVESVGAVTVPDNRVARLRMLLTDSIRLRLRSDVPVGTCLSGGMDSSAIVGLASGMVDGRVRTFTSVYPGTDSDESMHARVVAERFGAEPHWIEPIASDFASVVPLIAWHQDQPSAAPGLYSQWHVMKRAHGVVKVLLDGQGGDELLAGYPGFIADYVATRLLESLQGRASSLSLLAHEYSELAGQLGGSPMVAGIRALLPVSIRRIGRRLMRADALMAPAFRREWAPFEARPVKPHMLDNPLNSALYESLTRTSIPALLHYEDRNSMAFSLEARTPFLDYRVVEYCLALPAEDKIAGWRSKVVLREAVADLLPRSIVERRDKKGYPTPLALWLRSSLMPLVRDVLLSDEARKRGVLNSTAVSALLDRHERGEADFHWEIWRLLSLELWYRSFVDGFGAVTL